MLERRQTRPAVESIDGFTIRTFPNALELGTVPLTPTMFKEIARFDCDILHAHTILSPASFYSALASKVSRKPLVVTQHDYIYGGVHGPKLFLHTMNNNTFGRFTMHSASAVIGLSSAAARFVRRFGATEAKTRIIPNSVDTTLFRPDQPNILKKKWGIEGPVVLFVGRLTKQKRVDILLRAVREIVSDVPNTSLALVGSGPDESALRALQAQLGLDRIFFLGRTSWEQMRYIYPGCKVLVLPSVYEPFGNVVLEAMASGVPVVGSNIGGMADIIREGETGYRITPGDVQQLSTSLGRLLTDDGLRSRMAEAARKVAVERYDDVVMARSVEDLYRQCLGG